MIKYRPKWCSICKYYLPKKDASSHKCLNKNEVFIGESKIKCYAYTPKAHKELPAQISRCDFNCNKIDEPLILWTNPVNLHAWIFHLSCLKEQLETQEELLDE